MGHVRLALFQGTCGISSFPGDTSPDGIGYAALFPSLCCYFGTFQAICGQEPCPRASSWRIIMQLRAPSCSFFAQQVSRTAEKPDLWREGCIPSLLGAAASPPSSCSSALSQQRGLEFCFILGTPSSRLWLSLRLCSG